MAHGREAASAKLAIDEITPEAVVKRLSYRLSQFVGVGRRWSYQEVAHETLIDVRTLKAYVQGTACPNLVKYKRLLAVLGPGIGVDLNAMKGWLPRSDVIPPEALDLDELRLELRRAIGVLSQILDCDVAPSPLKSDAESKARLPEPTALTDQADTIARFRIALRPDRIDSAAVSSRLGYRLHRIIEHDKRCSLTTLVSATGIDRRTLQTYVDGKACPNLARYLRLGHYLGPEIGVELAYMIGWEPRFQQPLPLMRDQVDALMRSLKDAEDAVCDFRSTAVSSATDLRLIRPDSRLAQRFSPLVKI